MNLVCSSWVVTLSLEPSDLDHDRIDCWKVCHQPSQNTQKQGWNGWNPPVKKKNKASDSMRSTKCKHRKRMQKDRFSTNEAGIIWNFVNRRASCSLWLAKVKDDARMSISSILGVTRKSNACCNKLGPAALSWTSQNQDPNAGPQLNLPSRNSPLVFCASPGTIVTSQLGHDNSRMLPLLDIKSLDIKLCMKRLGWGSGDLRQKLAAFNAVAPLLFALLLCLYWFSWDFPDISSLRMHSHIPIPLNQGFVPHSPWSPKQQVCPLILTCNEKNDLWTNTTDLDIFQLICGILCPDRPGMLLLPASQGMMPHPASPSELITNSTNKFAWSALARPLLMPLRIQAQNSCTCKPLTCSCHDIECKKCCTRSTYLRLWGMQSCASFSPKASTTAAWGWSYRSKPEGMPADAVSILLFSTDQLLRDNWWSAMIPEQPYAKPC